MRKPAEAFLLRSKLLDGGLPMAKPKPKSTFLKGWQQIAEFLGLPISAAQRWANSGMPVTRDGRHERFQKN
jgi:hypothetical protein